MVIFCSVELDAISLGSKSAYDALNKMELTGTSGNMAMNDLSKTSEKASG